MMRHPVNRKQLRLVDHDPVWLTRYATEAIRIADAVGTRARSIEHVGSTAVPNLLAKPVIDIAVAVDDEGAADACIPQLETIGYPYRGTHGDDPQRRYYVRDAGDVRLAQLHLYILPASAWHAMLSFRDALLANPALVELYAAEKRRVAAAVGWDKAAYSVAKGVFIERVLGQLL